MYQPKNILTFAAFALLARYTVAATPGTVTLYVADDGFHAPCSDEMVFGSWPWSEFWEQCYDLGSTPGIGSYKIEGADNAEVNACDTAAPSAVTEWSFYNDVSNICSASAGGLVAQACGNEECQDVNDNPIHYISTSLNTDCPPPACRRGLDLLHGKH